MDITGYEEQAAGGAGGAVDAQRATGAEQQAHLLLSGELVAPLIARFIDIGDLEAAEIELAKAEPVGHP